MNNPCRASTPLHLAAGSGDADMTTFLINQGADVDARDLNKATPLHIAVEYEKEAVAQVLLEHE